MLSAVGAGVLLLTMLAWVWNELATIQSSKALFIARTVTAVIIAGGGGILLFWVMNKTRIVDFFIATDAEMRKVNWPTRREIIGSTWVVIYGTLFMAMLLWVVDLGFFALFQKIGILAGG